MRYAPARLRAFALVGLVKVMGRDHLGKVGVGDGDLVPRAFQAAGHPLAICRGLDRDAFLMPMTT